MCGPNPYELARMAQLLQARVEAKLPTDKDFPAENNETIEDYKARLNDYKKSLRKKK